MVLTTDLDARQHGRESNWYPNAGVIGAPAWLSYPWYGYTGTEVGMIDAAVGVEPPLLERENLALWPGTVAIRWPFPGRPSSDTLKTRMETACKLAQWT